MLASVRVLAHPRFVALGVALAAACPFLGTIHAEFVDWDDGISIFDNPHIRSLDASALHWMFTDVTYNPRFMPLTWLGWAITYHFVGLEPAAYHLGNVLLHAANAALVFALIRGLFNHISGQATGVSTLCAGAAALFWAVHPLRSEPVAWATDRSYEQSLLFALLAVLLYFYSARHEGPRRRLYWGSVASFVACVLTYPACLGAAMVPLILDFYPLRRIGPGRAAMLRLAAEKVPFFAAAGIGLAITLASRASAPASLGLGPLVTLETFDWFRAAMKAFYVWTYYVWRPLFPVNLSPVYTDLLDFDPWSPPFLGSAVIVVLVTTLAVRMRTKAPGVAAIWLSHLALLAPVLGVTERLAYPSDRYSYAQGICWAVVIAYLLRRVILSAPSLARTVAVVGASAVILGTLGFMARAQAAIWNDSVSLFTHIIGSLGDDTYRYNIYWRLGRHHMKRGDWAAAAEGFNKTLEGIPRHFEALRLRGVLELHGGQPMRAAADLATALEIRDDAEVRMQFALALALQGRTADAIEHLQQAVGLSPELFEARRHLAIALANAGRRAEAVRHAEAALELNPNEPGAIKLLQELRQVEPAQ